MSGIFSGAARQGWVYEARDRNLTMLVWNWFAALWIIAVAISLSVIGMRMGYEVQPGSNGKHRPRKYLMVWKKRVIKKNLAIKYVKKKYLFTV